MCPSCKLTIIRRKGDLCAVCSKPTWKGRIKERYVGEKLIEWAEDELVPMFTLTDKTLPNNEGFKYRIDFYYDLGSYFVACEVDEHEHSYRSYPPRCELVRMYNITKTRQTPGVFIRFNPDELKINGETTRVSKQQRECILLQTLQNYFQTSLRPTGFLTIVYICYSQPSVFMHGERSPYMSTHVFNNELEYEQFVGSVYPKDCQSTGPWYSRN